ncbi:MAG: hypothetical protein IPK82_23175 [Polyangiaceae bacterium]|nr:hypothetical protein [Polyangiaceae bacterium]
MLSGDASGDANAPDDALCLTKSAYTTLPAPLPSYRLVENFTISFWAKARESLDDPVFANPIMGVRQRGLLLRPIPDAAGNSADIGFYLGTNGFDVVRHFAGAPVLETCTFQRDGDRPAGCLCQNGDSVSCIDTYVGTVLDYDSADVSDNRGPQAVGCTSQLDRYLAYPSRNFSLVCGNVLGYCNKGSSVACCLKSGCTSCVPVTNCSVGSWASIAVHREPFLGWHHFALVMSDGEAFVYVDGRPTSRANVRSIPNASFRLSFGTYRDPVRWAGYPTSFEGWIGDVRLANRSMHGGEALAQFNNASAWDFSLSTNRCSGENHTGTDVEPFSIQQAWLVCKEPLPNCTTTGGFTVGERAGCLCEALDGSRNCVGGGEWSLNDSVLARPFARWQLDQSGTIVVDTSGNGFDGQIKGANLSVLSDGAYTSFRGNAYVDFGGLNGFQFETRDFAVEAWIRFNSTDSMVIVGKRHTECVTSGWVFLLRLDRSD